MTNYFREQILTLPQLIADVAEPFAAEAARIFDANVSRSIVRLYTLGCGDSYFAALGSELAFEMLGGVPTEAQNAMTFSRYASDYLPAVGSHVIGVSVSGGVTRTIEGVTRAGKRGAHTYAITSAETTPIAKAVQHVLTTRAPDVPNDAGVQVPGARSYFASLMMLYVSAIRIGEMRGTLSSADAQRWRTTLAATADAATRTIDLADAAARALAQDTRTHTGDFVFCGAGPNFGTALFCAAKMLEATGDAAIGQDIEEWAHLQYFARFEATPTFLISAGERDASRAEEIRTAMHAIGRRIVELPQAPCSEVFAPLISAIPAMLFAAHRAELLGEPYFRGFAGGRSIEHGGGISRIRTSTMEA
ncbi:MAG: SIS domain-containing protein [Chloroflexi bacterium]|nr:SIS domain-containing protein [Chloroflexota bacterium]